MKSNIGMFWVLAVYFAFLGAVYIVWNIVAEGRIEWSGTTPLVLSAGLSGMIAFYLGLVRKNQGGELHMDSEESDIDDEDPEVGHFSPWTWWPIILAIGPSLFLIGLTLNGNFFLTFFSIPVIIIGVIGWVYEYYRGLHAR